MKTFGNVHFFVLVTAQVTSEALDLGKSSVHRILTWKFGNKRFSPRCQNCRLLSKSCDEKNCTNGKTWDDGDKFLQSVVTGDETWIYEYDIEMKFRARSGEKRIVWNKAKIGDVDHVFWLPWKCSWISTWKSNCPCSFRHGGKCLKDCVRCVQPNLSKEACSTLHHEDVRVLCVDSVQVFSTQFHHSAETPSLLARFCPLWLFLVLQMQTGSPMAAFRGCDYNFRGNDSCWSA